MEDGGSVRPPCLLCRLRLLLQIILSVPATSPPRFISLFCVACRAHVLSRFYLVGASRVHSLLCVPVIPTFPSIIYLIVLL